VLQQQMTMANHQYQFQAVPANRLHLPVPTTLALITGMMHLDPSWRWIHGHLGR
jgi:hypothetical protein